MCRNFIVAQSKCEYKLHVIMVLASSICAHTYRNNIVGFICLGRNVAVLHLRLVVALVVVVVILLGFRDSVVEVKLK